MGSGRNKTLNAHPRSLDQCLDTVYSSNQSILSVLYFCPVFSKPLTINFMLTIHTMLQEGHIEDMTAKWLSLTPNPLRIPIFYTLTKIHKLTPVGRPIISGCDGPTEQMSAFVDRLIQPIVQKQDSYLKDTTDFLNFIESTKLPKNTVLVSMDVTSLYTNIPHEEGVTTECHAYEDFYGDKAPIPPSTLEKCSTLY